MQIGKSINAASAVIGKNYLIRVMLETDVPGAVSLQSLAFPSLSIEEHLNAAQVYQVVRFFRQGQFVIVHGDEVIASTSTITCSGDFALGSHSFKDAVNLANDSRRQYAGEWMYGLDIAVRPEYRGLGMGRALYQARQRAVSDCGLRGQYTVGLLSGFAAAKSDLSVSEYYEQVISGEAWDPVVSIQMKIGFKPIKLVPSYVHDPGCGNSGVLMILSADAHI